MDRPRGERAAGWPSALRKKRRRGGRTPKPGGDSDTHVDRDSGLVRVLPSPFSPFPPVAHVGRRTRCHGNHLFRHSCKWCSNWYQVEIRRMPGSEFRRAEGGTQSAWRGMRQAGETADRASGHTCFREQATPAVRSKPQPVPISGRLLLPD